MTPLTTLADTSNTLNYGPELLTVCPRVDKTAHPRVGSAGVLDSWRIRSSSLAETKREVITRHAHQTKRDWNRNCPSSQTTTGTEDEGLNAKVEGTRMVIQGIFGRRWVQCLGMAGIAAGGYMAGLMTDRVIAQQPAPAQLPTADKRIVAYVYGNVPVYRDELGDFLIMRGGFEKLDLLVNKRIIEIEAAKRNITVTALEVQASLETDVRGLGISIGDFTKQILEQRYHKTLYEWTEDVIKPKLMLGKMCGSRVKVSEEDIKKAFENKYGEKRQAKIICWNKEDQRAAERQWDEARKSDVDFDRIARSQATPSLAASCGQIAPVGRYADVEDATATAKLYELKVGEMSGLFQTSAGIMCIKLIAIVPPDPTWFKLTDQTFTALRDAKVPDALLAKLNPLKNKELYRDDFAKEINKVLASETLTPEEMQRLPLLIWNHAGDLATSYTKVHQTLEREVYDKKLAAEIPKFFGELKVLAKPDLMLKGPPSSADILEAAKQELKDLQQTGGTQPGSAPHKP